MGSVAAAKIPSGETGVWTVNARIADYTNSFHKFFTVTTYAKDGNLEFVDRGADKYTPP